MNIINRVKFLIVFVSLFLSFAYSQTENQTIVNLDLNTATENHKFKVVVFAPAINENEVEFHFPKIVPGTYTINNFGRFVSDLSALDADGNKLKSEQLDTNRWKIYDAVKLKKLEYWVEDTYHSSKKPVVFEPTGLCIEKGKVFVLNNYCYVGYFNGYKDLPFTLNIIKPEGFYGSTSMPVSVNGLSDTYTVSNYFELHDNPILYCIPDTSTVMVNNTRVLISIYSPNKKVTADYLKSHTEQLFDAQGKYLGGELPADKYSILVYLFEGSSASGAAGALEHFKATTMSYPEVSNEEFIEPFKDVISHEFFHIVTPLSVHSEEVQYFDFINPKMSKHLWLYEGSTEYYAQHVQVKYGIVPVEKFFDKMRQKLFISSFYFNDTLPFTELSKGALDKYKQQYVNVYQKGALLSMCLDLYLLKLSGGKYGLQNLKQELGNRFGPEKPFKDDELFDIITEMTYPEIRGFFTKYVEGNNKLPYDEFLGFAGYNFYKEYEKQSPAMIGASLQNNSEGLFEVVEVSEFGNKLKLKEGDVIFSVNGKEINVHNLEEVGKEFEKTAKEGDLVTVVVLRKNSDGKQVKKTLSANTIITTKKEMFVIQPVKNPTPEQLAVRKSWLNQ